MNPGNTNVIIHQPNKRSIFCVSILFPLKQHCSFKCPEASAYKGYYCPEIMNGCHKHINLI